MKTTITGGLFLLVACGMQLSSLAQRPIFQPAAHQWLQQPERGTLDAVFASEDAVILSEQHNIRVHGANPRFMTIVFEKHVKLRYNTVQGIIDHARFILPESLDPLMDQRDVPKRLHGKLPSPKYFNMEVLEFGARIIQPDGGILQPAVKDSLAVQQVKFGVRFHDAWTFAVDLEGVEPGDELELYYKYSIPYDVNWFKFNSQRIFFHGNLPKQNSILTFKADVRQDLHLAGTAAHQVEGKNQKTFRWVFQNIPGCMDEVNARPHTELPHIKYGLVQTNLRYRQRHTLSYQTLDIPYWTYILKLREHNALWLRRVAQKRIPDKQNQLVKAFVQASNSKQPNAPAHLQMEQVHERIALDFRYQKDDAWFNNRDQKLMRMGSQVKEQRIRELVRYDLYAKLANLVELPYHTAYLMDSRVGAMAPDYLSPLWNSEFAFVHLGTKGMTIFHPKGEHLSMHSNELPFYWRGDQALLVHVDQLWSDAEQVPHFLTIPESDAVHDLRNTNAKVEVKVQRSECRFQTKVNLSGQFSTLTGPAFRETAMDSTLAPEYGNTVTGLVGATTVTQRKLLYQENDPPFREQWRLNYSNASILWQLGDSLVLELSGALNFVAPDGFEAGKRDLAFYWDLAMLDNFNYQLVFDQKVEFLGSSVNPFNLENDLATAHFQVEQTGSNTLMVSAFLDVKEKVVPVQRAYELQEILDAVNSLSDLQLCLRANEQKAP